MPKIKDYNIIGKENDRYLGHIKATSEAEACKKWLASPANRGMLWDIHVKAKEVG